MKKAVLTLIAALIVMMGAIGFGRNLRNDETVLASSHETAVEYGNLQKAPQSGIDCGAILQITPSNC